MDSRIGQLDLAIRAPGERLVEVTRGAESFATEVLRRCDALLEERAPGRVLLMRQLEMHWRLLDGSLRDEGEINAFADEVAADLDARARAYGSPPVAEQDLVVFEEQAHWRAAHLEAVGRGTGRTAWYFERLEAEGEPPGALRAFEHRTLARAVLARLLKDGTLLETLSALPITGLTGLAAAVGAPSGGDVRALGATTLPPHLKKLVSTLPASTSPAVAALFCLAAARGVMAASADHEAAGIAATALAQFLSNRATDGVSQTATDGVMVGTRGAADVDLASAARVPEVCEVETRFGGLFYLLNLALELSLGETLWKACLPEGAFLTRVAAAILGDAGAGDPAPSLFGGTALDAPLPPVSPEQHAEVATTILGALVEALPRRGLARLPQVTLALVDHPAGRLLIAAAPGSPFALFAWPALSPEMTQAGLETFIATWPRAAPVPRASPGLASLDRSGRACPQRSASILSKLLLPVAGDASTTALLAQSAGSLCHVFETRLRTHGVGRIADLVERHLRVPGHLLLAPESMWIQISMQCIEITIRRAALDTDPGWVPWLNRTVRFVYGPSELTDHAHPDES